MICLICMPSVLAGFQARNKLKINLKVQKGVQMIIKRKEISSYVAIQLLATPLTRSRYWLVVLFVHASTIPAGQLRTSMHAQMKQLTLANLQDLISTLAAIITVNTNQPKQVFAHDCKWLHSQNKLTVHCLKTRHS